MVRPLKILHLFDFYLPNTMNWAYQLLRHTPGVEQWVAAPWVVQNVYFDQDFRFFIRPLQKSARSLPVDEWKVRWLSTNLIRLEKRWPVYKNWLFRQLQQDPPDMLHAHFGPVGCHYLDLAHRFDIPLVVSFYGYDFQRLPFQKPMYRSRYQKLFQQASAITTTGPHTPEMLKEQGCSSDKITPIPLSICLMNFQWFERKKVPGQLKLVQVATITDKKGHLDTLEALRLALQHCTNLHLTFVGERQDKSLANEMAGFIKLNQLGQHITWLSPLPHEALPTFLRQFDVFIHPSRQTVTRDCEGAPVSILEAQATGLPVIATLHADIPATVRHGITGMLSPEQTPWSLAQSIKTFYDMDNLTYQQFSRAARIHIEQNFDVITTGKQLKVLYEGLIG